MPICCGEVSSICFTDPMNNPYTQHLRRGEKFNKHTDWLAKMHKSNTILQYTNMPIPMPICCGEVSSICFTDCESNPHTQHLRRGEAFNKHKWFVRIYKTVTSFLQYISMSILMPICCGEVSSICFIDRKNNPHTQHLWRGETLNKYI